MKKLLVLLATSLTMLLLAITPAKAESHGGGGDGVHRLALQISDNSAQKMNTVLNVAANVTRYYEERGEQVEIRIVAFNAGLHMLRTDTSPVLERLTSFGQSMPNVSFAACNNTIHGMTRKEGKEPPITEYAEVVPAGVIELMRLHDEGWVIIRP